MKTLGLVKRMNRNSKKSDVLQVNKAVSSKKDPVFEAKNKLHEKKGRREGQSPSLCCFRLVHQGTKVPLLQVPSSSVVDGFSGAIDSAEMFKLQNSLFQQALKGDPHFATQVKSRELMLRVCERVASVSAGETDPEDAELVRSLGSGFAGSVDRELQSQDCVPAQRSGRVFVCIRVRLQVRVQESLDRLSSVGLSHLFRIQIIHPWVLHVLSLHLLLLLLLLLFAHLLVHVLLVLLVLCTHVALCHPCMTHMHIIRGRTRSADRVPGKGRGAKRELPLQPKICALFQRWRQG